METELKKCFGIYLMKYDRKIMSFLKYCNMDESIILWIGVIIACSSYYTFRNLLASFIYILLSIIIVTAINYRRMRMKTRLIHHINRHYRHGMHYHNL